MISGCETRTEKSSLKRLQAVNYTFIFLEFVVFKQLYFNLLFAKIVYFGLNGWLGRKICSYFLGTLGKVHDELGWGYKFQQREFGQALSVFNKRYSVWVKYTYLGVTPGLLVVRVFSCS